MKESKALDKPFLSVPEAAIRSTLSERHFRRLLAENKIAVLRVGRRVVIEATEIDRFIRSQSGGGDE
jgi:excisionase family DNA binding protein